jgi:hypothetical protein
MVDPKLRVRSSGFGGSGYAIPTWLDDKGKPTIVPSVTTITGVTAKPGIVQWAVDQTAAYAVANVDALLSRTEDQGWGMLRWYHKRTPDFELGDLRNYHSGVLNDAAELGTSVHEYIEADMMDGFPPAITTPEMDEMVARWEQFKTEHTIEPLLVEATVVNKDRGYAGTLDGVWVIDGVVTLLDVKTSRSTWPEHRQQLAALGACDTVMVEVEYTDTDSVAYTSVGETTYWVEKPMPKFEDYKILHLRPTDYDNNGNVIDSFCQLEDVTDLDLHFEGFLGALALKKYERELNSRNKTKEKED